MSIRTIPFEYGGLWNESFPELLVQTCTVRARVEVRVRVRVRVSNRVRVRVS